MRFLLAALFTVGVLGVAAYGTFVHVRADQTVTEACEHPAPQLDGVEPLLANPVVIQQDYRVNCGTVDGGAAVSIAVPMDGGSAANPVKGESWYVAPISGSSVNVRVGASDVTSSTGIEIGTTGLAGPLVTIDGRGPIYCKSEGAAQQVDVTVGRQ